MSDQTCVWTGSSGKQYKYWISDINATFKATAGNYIFAKESSPGRWAPLYIGESDNLSERLANHDKLPCVLRNGGTHIHAHANSSGDDARRAEESDLISAYNPACNKE